MKKPAEAYERPRVYKLGQVSNLTLGNGGSTTDGNGLNNQLGGGNDGVPGTVNGSGKGN